MIVGKQKTMKRIKVNSPEAIEITIKALLKGQIVIYPTDTIYGFGCDATNNKAIIRLNELKGRQSPMSVIAPNKNIAISWLNITSKEERLLLKNFNNGNTIIAPAQEGLVQSKILGEKNTLGIRVPNYSFCKSLSNSFSKPITTTSVNKTGFHPHTNPDLIEKEFSNEVSVLVDDGILISPPSSILKLEMGKLVTIRK